MIKALMIIDRYHPVWGGAENQLAALSTQLQTKDVQVSILTRRWTLDLATEEMSNGVVIYRTGVPGNSTVWKDACYVFGLILHVLRYRNHIDIVHTHGAVLLGVVGKICSVLVGKPNVVKIATAGKITSLQQRWWGKAVLSVLKRSSKVIAISTEIESELQTADVPISKITRIPNGVDTERFSPVTSEVRKKMREERGLNSEEQVILFSGRIVPRKGLDLLIDSWTVVSAKFPSAQLWILGSGTNQPDSVEEELQLRIKNEQLSRIRWLGETTEPENFYQIADIFAFPSRQEGLSNTLLEAMACGLPSVASHIGGNTDILEHRINGLLFTNDDAADLTENLLNLLESSEKRQKLSVAARADIVENYHLNEISRRYSELYRQLVETQ
ncbi:glycosyltransferase family 4 protein [Kiritimatiellota bacterium B12222]|nr:glycosyltransferase family 4 protein [Kiritimatiellota bacterium B12222]